MHPRLVEPAEGEDEVRGPTRLSKDWRKLVTTMGSGKQVSERWEMILSDV